MYDNYISLGSNCEVGFQLRRWLGRDVATFFNWLVTPLDALVKVIEADFAGVYAKENLRPTGDEEMIFDAGSGLKFHSAFRKELGRNLSGPRFDELYAESAAKYAMLAQRFRTLAQSSNRVAYLVKTTDEEARHKTMAVHDVLKAHYPDHNFTLVALQTSDREEADWGEANVRNRYLTRFADPSRAHDGHVPSWDRIFSEFPLRAEAVKRVITILAIPASLSLWPELAETTCALESCFSLVL